VISDLAMTVQYLAVVFKRQRCDTVCSGADTCSAWCAMAMLLMKKSLDCVYRGVLNKHTMNDHAACDDATSLLT
jgi:hypothetical protein